MIAEKHARTVSSITLNASTRVSLLSLRKSPDYLASLLFPFSLSFWSVSLPRFPISAFFRPIGLTALLVFTSCPWWLASERPHGISFSDLLPFPVARINWPELTKPYKFAQRLTLSLSSLRFDGSWPNNSKPIHNLKHSLNTNVFDPRSHAHATARVHPLTRFTRANLLILGGADTIDLLKM